MAKCGAFCGWIRPIHSSSPPSEVGRSVSQSPRCTAKDFAAQATDPAQTPPRTLAFVQMITAAAALRQGDLDEAVDVATSSVEGSGTLRSNRYLSYVADFQAALTDAHPNDLAASGFIARVRETLPGLERLPSLPRTGP